MAMLEVEALMVWGWEWKRQLRRPPSAYQLSLQDIEFLATSMQNALYQGIPVLL